TLKWTLPDPRGGKAGPSTNSAKAVLGGVPPSVVEKFQPFRDEPVTSTGVRSTWMMVILVSQRSVAVAMPVLVGSMDCPHCTVNPGGQVMDGGFPSKTVTVNEQVLELPAASVALAVTAVTPSGKVDPLGGSKVTTGLVSQLSVAIAEKVTLVFEHEPGSELTTMGAGQVMAGALVSNKTVIV